MYIKEIYVIHKVLKILQWGQNALYSIEGFCFAFSAALSSASYLFNGRTWTRFLIYFIYSPIENSNAHKLKAIGTILITMTSEERTSISSIR